MIQVVKWTVRWALRYYFESIYLLDSEKWPKNKPVILAGSHSNSAMDAILLSALSGPRPIWWLARGDAFNNKWIAKLLNFFEMAPIYRSTEFGKVTAAKKNLETFEFSFGILKNNETIGMFPEGITVHSRQLQQPLKKGLANMAFQAHELLKKPIYIVPVGISYNHLAETRGSVYIKFGEPLSTEQYIKAYLKNENETIKAFNTDLLEAIQENYLATDHPNSKVEDATINKINAHYKLTDVKNYGLSHNPAQYNTLRKALENNAENLNLTPNKFMEAYYLICFSVLQIFWLIPNQMAKFLVTKVAKRKEFYTTVRFGLSLIIYPIYLLVSSILASLVLPFMWYYIVLGQMLLVFWGLLCKSMHKNYLVTNQSA
jgi:1-acyl-sn-glycerol-3-phosphate acyltransferase